MLLAKNTLPQLVVRGGRKTSTTGSAAGFVSRTVFATITLDSRIDINRESRQRAK